LQKEVKDMIRQFLSLGSGVTLALFANLSWSAGDWYVSGSAGATFLNDADISGDVITTVATIRTRSNFKSEHDTGFTVMGAMGRRVGDNFRLEAEIGYRRNALDNITAAPTSAFTDTHSPGKGVDFNVASGDVSALSFMVNAFYDIPLDMPLKPYLGGGVGLAHLWADAVAHDPTIPIPASCLILGDPSECVRVVDISDNDTVFAYQFGAGLGYEIIPNLTASVDYRYFATTDPSFSGPKGSEFDAEYRTHNVSLNLRYGF
jgi:opacity protein-like surface antigen